MDELQLEILNQIKELSISHATLATKLESHLDNQVRLEEKLDSIMPEIKKVSKHELIIKGFLWAYGLLLSAFVYPFFSHRAH